MDCVAGMLVDNMQSRLAGHWCLVLLVLIWFYGPLCGLPSYKDIL